MALLQQFLIYTRGAIEAIDETLAGEFAQVEVSGLVLCQEDKVPTAHVHHLGFAFGVGDFVVFVLHQASAARAVRLDANDGLEGNELGAFFFGFGFEFAVGFLAAVE